MDQLSSVNTTSCSAVWNTLLVSSCLLISVGGFLFGLLGMVQTLETQGGQMAMAFETYIEEATKGSILLAEALATDRELARVVAQRDRSAAEREGDRLEQLRQTSRVDAIFVMDAAGDVLVTSNWRQKGSFLGKNYSFRPYFRKALSLGQGQFLALGVTSKRMGFYLARPLSEKVGVVVVKMGLPLIEKGLKNSISLTGRQYLLADQQGVVFSTSVADWRFRTLRPLSSIALDRVRRHRQYEGQSLAALNLPQNSTDNLIPFHRLAIPGSRAYQHLTWRPLTTANWQLAAVIPVKEATPVFWALWLPATLLAIGLYAGGLLIRRKNVEVFEESRTDDLTGLHTRRYMLEVVPEMIREGRRLVLVLFDIDGLKRLNDQAGQLEGDRYLKCVSRRIRESFAGEGIGVRYGGDEFALFLDQIQPASAMERAEELRRSIESLDLGSELPSLTASVGLTVLRDGDTLDTFIQRAGHQLFRAKEEGGNCMAVDPLAELRVDTS